MRVLGLDPGVHNFAWALYDTDTSAVECSGMLTGHQAMHKDWRFLESLLEVLATTQPDFVAMERFAFRKEASVESEPINQMIGKVDLLCRMRGLRVVMMLPAHWKVQMHVKDLPKGSRSIFDLPIIHQADAACIAKYAYEAGLRKAEEAEAADTRKQQKAERARVKAEKAAAVSERRQARSSARGAAKQPRPE